MNKGWISINRKIQDHWLWKDKREFSKLEAWLDILLTVNHTDKKVLIKNTLFTVKRGESINSLDTWSYRWNWNKSKVRRFLKMLENDSMIVTKNERKTTRLTVCKYDCYQDTRNANETQMKRKRNADETQMTPNNNDNKYNNYNNENNNDEVKENILYDIDDNFKFYINNQKIVNAVISNKKNKIKDKEYLEKRLKEFNISLTETGQDKKLFTDYCSHFRSWHIKTLPKVNGYNHQKIIL